MAGKPILIIPPYVLGANILSFLPGEKRSYVHCFANQGIPTYIRVLKKIDESEALQTMSGEDDTNDTRRFAEHICGKHERGLTLNGYCQGGFNALCNLLSGELDNLVADHPEVAVHLAGLIDRWRAGLVRYQAENDDGSLVETDEEMLSRLRELGYMQ